MQICLLGLLSGLTRSTGCVPHYPPGPKGSIWGVRNACQSRRKKTCKSIEFEPQKQHLIRNAKRGMSVFPRELSHFALRSPPRDPLTYRQIYYVLAHLGLRNHVFYRPDQNRPCQQPPGDPPATPGASWRPPGHPPRPGSQSDRENAALRPPRVAGSTCFTAPEQTRVAIGPRKRGTLHGQVACFPGGKPFLARKVAFGPRGLAKPRRESRYFRAVNPAREGIRTHIYKS